MNGKELRPVFASQELPRQSTQVLKPDNRLTDKDQLNPYAFEKLDASDPALARETSKFSFDLMS